MPIIGGGLSYSPGHLICQEVLFTEESGTGNTYTGTVTVPPNSWIIDIKIYASAVWTSSVSATLDVGDGVDADGWYAALDAVATDLLAGEVLSLGVGGTGGKPGVYLVAATSLKNTQWSVLQRVITGKVVTVTAAGSTAGRTRMLVVYTTTSQPIPATKA